jgi:antitoxin component YwqK of YwqJK toxin-antitoxin module
MRYLFVILLPLLFACGEEPAEQKHPAFRKLETVQKLILRSDDSLLTKKNGDWFYKNIPFSGTIETFDEAGVLRARQSFIDGKEDGLSHTYYADGKPDAARYYRAGEKDSIARGWWPNGNLRFEYHFHMGKYEGDFKEWYTSGKPLKHISYHQGKEQWGRGWRENGKPYMSFEVRDGRMYGSINPNLCYSLKNEKGEYIAARK